MKKTIRAIIPLFCVSVIFIMYQFACNGNGDTFTTLFGNGGDSPLKNDSEAKKAFEIQKSFRKIFDLYKDRVVFITTEQFIRIQSNPNPFMRGELYGENLAPDTRVRKRKGFGSGFILSEDGYICTNYHVVAGVDNVRVKIDDRTYVAKIVGSDQLTDIALLKINPGKKLKAIYFGDSEKVEVGDWAIAIGNPFGLDRTFTVGVVSAIGRTDLDLMGGSHIQTDASINPGNSGGPLINIYGEVVGINRMIYSKSGGYMGIGFAIPINTAKSVLSQLQQYKRIKRGYLGIQIAPISPNYAKQLGVKSKYGAFVGSIVRNSPADKAGLKVGDVIIKVNDKYLQNFRQLISSVGQAPVGTRLKLTVLRHQRPMNIYVRIAERPKNMRQ